MDDSYTTCYLPFYCGIDAVPKSFTGGSIEKFSWDSAWWVFNLASNYAYRKYSLHGARDPGGAEGHRIEPAGPAAGRREDGGRAVGDAIRT